MKNFSDQISHIYNVKKIERSANHSQIRIMEKFKITKKAKIAMAAVCAVIAAFGGISFAQRTTLADYKNITLKKEKTTAKKSEIDSYIQQAQQQYQKEVKRAAKKGDVVIFSRSGTCKNKIINELHMASAQAILGKDQFKKGYDKQLIGMKPGQNKTFNYTYGKKDTSDHCAGKTVKVSITVKNVYEVPKLTDSFVKKNLMYDNVVAYKKYVKNMIETQKKKEAKSYYEETAWNKVMNGTTVRKYPKSIMKECTDQLDKFYRSSAKNQGMKWSAFIKNYFKTEAKYKSQLKKQAKKQAKERIVIQKIAKKEGISYTDKEYKKREKKLAENFGYQSVKNLEKNNDKSTIKAYIMKQDILKIIMKNVKYK